MLLIRSHGRYRSLLRAGIFWELPLGMLRTAPLIGGIRAFSGASALPLQYAKSDFPTACFVVITMTPLTPCGPKTASSSGRFSTWI